VVRASALDQAAGVDDREDQRRHRGDLPQTLSPSSLCCATRRRRECRACGRRFTTEEWPHTEGWLGELPTIGHGISGPLEAVRRRAILAAARDENARELAAAIDGLERITAELKAIFAAAEECERAEAVRR
jgi:hypothetical protein